MKKRFFTPKELCMTALFTAITAVFAQVIIPLPFTPLPISFGLVAVYLAGIFLPPKCAIASQIIYLVMGGIGLPVFAGFQGGLGRLLGPTGGCLFAYPFMAAVISLTLNRSSEACSTERSARIPAQIYLNAFASVFAALLIVYLFATSWLSLTMGISLVEASLLSVAPFIVIDIVKVFVTVLIFLPVRKQFLKAGIITLPKGMEQA